MTTTYRPGGIIVDEASTLSLGMRPPSGEPDWPAGARWLERIFYWLDWINHTRVGGALLRALEQRPTLVEEVWVVPMAVADYQAWTEGLFNADQPEGRVGPPAVFVMMNPPDSRGQLVPAGPASHPGSILAHELVHALMTLHRLNSPGQPSGESVLGSIPYPNHSEFSAVTVQNMLLSETDSSLHDGYSNDDPNIRHELLCTGQHTRFGTTGGGSVIVNMEQFQANNRLPLEHLRMGLPAFVADLEKLSVPFNPFARSLRHLSTPHGDARRRMRQSRPHGLPG